MTIYDEMLDAMRKLGPPPRNPLEDFLRPPSFMGMKLYEAPPPPPMIQVRDITFDDGTSILPDEFRAEVNLWLLQRFGLQEDFFKDKAFLISGFGILANKRNVVMLTNLGV